MDNQELKKEQYVLGFYFDKQRENVVLIRKNRPEWQRGFLNGVGGKIEPGEEPRDAMIREFKEEARSIVLDWSYFGIISEESLDVHCFKASGSLSKIGSTGDELIFKVPIFELLNPTCNILPDANWLIHSALDDNAKFLKIRYSRG